LESGDELFWIVFSAAEDSLPDGLPKNSLKREYFNVTRDLSLEKENYKIYDFKVRHLHQYRQDILEDLIRTRNQYDPEIVIGPSLNDLHQDHQVVAHEMVRAFKTTSSIISYELPWNHVTFNTQRFCKLNKSHIEKKYQILENYRSQFIKGKSYFSEEYIYGLAKTRGIQCNSEYAEAFEVVRWMI